MKIAIIILIFLSMVASPYFIRQDNGKEKQTDALTAITEKSKDIPPSVAIATAGMGPFRGYLLAILWTRVLDLELNEEYSESFEIARWIARLQPRYPAIWKYQATQLSVNMPGLFPDKEDKWVKLSQGIDLLREEGIVMNPQSHQLYDYLGWIYYNRIGQAIDANHEYYGAKIAHEMQSLLGRRLVDGRYGKEVLAEQFDRVVNAVPFEDYDNPDYAALKKKLNDEGMKLNGDFLKMWNRFEIYIRSAGFLTQRQKNEDLKIPEVNNAVCLWLKDNPRVVSLVNNKILPYLQKESFKYYNMDPSIMKQMVLDYGPLDWRHPNVLALYWSRLAISVLDDANINQMAHSITTARMEYIYLLGMIRNGRVHYDPWNNTCRWLPEPSFIVPCAEALDRMREKVVQGKLRTDQNWVYEEKNLFKAYMGFMDTAIMTSSMYSEDAESAAGRYFEILKSKVMQKRGSLPPEMQGTVDDYILTRLGDFVGERKDNIRQFVRAMMGKALWDGLAEGKVKVFTNYLDRAQKVYEMQVSVDPSKYLTENFRTLILQSCVDEFKNERVSIESKLVVWHRLDSNLRLAITPLITSYFNDLCNQHGLDVTKNFQVKKIESNNNKSSS